MRRCLLLAFAISATALAQNPVGQLFSSDAKVKGSVELAAGGAHVMSGSFVSAGGSTAVLKLDRGGEVRVCARTTVSVATSQSGRDLALGLSSGAMETHYTIAASADTIVTPDFRLLLAGPGRFDFAIESAKNGDTCVRALPGNSSSLIVSELMGDATYQVKPAERLVFRSGHLQDPDHDNANCGCVSTPPVLTAESLQPPQLGTSSPSAGSGQALTATSSSTNPSLASDAASGPPTEDRQPNPPVHVEVDAPFVFHGDDPASIAQDQVVTLHLNHKPLPIVVLPPTPTEVAAAAANVPKPTAEKVNNKPRQSGVFGRLKSFFAAVFH